MFLRIKYLFSYILLIISVAVLPGCNKNEPQKFRIGVSQCSGGDWREKMNEEIRRELLFYPDATVEIRNADDDSERQIADIQYFIDNNFDIILTAPNEGEAIAPVVSKAFFSGIPVVIFDRKIPGDNYTAYIDLDNEGIGRLAADYVNAVAKENETDILEITGLKGSTPAIERHAGFIEGLKSNPNIHLLASVEGQWSEELAYSLADSVLSVHPSIKIIYAHNDPMAIGASRIFKERGRDDIIILGTDASPLSGMKAVKEGMIDATFIYPTEGQRLVKTAMAILHGEPFSRIDTVKALAPVDPTNADILIRQYELLKDETEKIDILDEENEQLWVRNRLQNSFLWIVIGFAIALTILSTLLIIVFIKNRRLGKILSIRDLLASEKRKKEIIFAETPHDRIDKEDGNTEGDESSNDEEPQERESHDISSLGTSTNTEFYNRFVAIIKKRYKEQDLSVVKIASELSLGGAQLARKIRSQTGYYPVEILRTYRLEKAKELLNTTDMTINEITHSVGFSSPAYLAKCFREAYGMTPSEFREK